MQTTNLPVYTREALQDELVQVRYWLNPRVSGETKQIEGRVSTVNLDNFTVSDVNGDIGIFRIITWDAVVDLRVRVLHYEPVFVALGEVKRG